MRDEQRDDDWFAIMAAVPREVLELAQQIRYVSDDEAADSYTDPLDPVIFSDNGDHLDINWFGLGRRSPVAGIPSWKWQEIVGELEQVFRSYTKRVIEAIATEVEEGIEDIEVSNLLFERSEECSKLLLRSVAETMNVYLRTPPDIQPEQAEGLTPRQWEVVALVLNRGLDLPEAAKQLDIEPSTARRHFNDAAAMLGMTAKALRRRRLAVGGSSPFDRSNVPRLPYATKAS